MSGLYNDLLGPEENIRTQGGRPRVVALRDFAHASNIFRSNNYKLAPKHKFLFHVYFEINPGNYAVPFPDDYNISVLVKTIKLPSFTTQQQELNQYNRKRTVQTKIRYDNVDITWHDDNSNLMRNLWYNYYTYYYGDSLNKSEVASPSAPITQNLARNNGARYDFTDRSGYRGINPQLSNQVWGYYGETQPGSGTGSPSKPGVKPPFFKNIYIYGLSQHRATTYVLINPLISTFSHDTYAYNEGNGVMENRMTISYEFVKYSEGGIDGTEPSTSVPDFATESNYDRRPSPRMSPGANRKLIGPSGYVEADGGYMSDLSTANGDSAATNKSSIAYNTNKTQNLEKNVLVEISREVTITQAYIGGSSLIRNASFNFPVYGQTGMTSGTAGSETDGTSAPQEISKPSGAQ